MSSDPRDTNRDGHVSLMEKVKDKLHLGHKDTTAATHTTATTHTTYTGTSAGAFDARDRNHDGHVSMGEKLKGSSMDQRDLNHDGHISTGERLAGVRQEEEARMRLHEEQLALGKQKVGAGEVGLKKHIETERIQEQIPVKHEEVIVERRPLSGIPDPNARISNEGEIIRVPLYKEEVIAEKQVVPKEEIVVRKQEKIGHDTVNATLRSEFVEGLQSSTHLSTTGAFDARDTNRDGHVSMGEKLQAGTHSSTGAFDARDTNRDGHVSMGEKLKADTFGTHNSTGAFDARDTNRDGHVSTGEKLKADAFGTHNTTGAYDSRDLNRDGHVSMGEKLGAGAAGAAPGTHKAARG
jgi:uncharacterized protein (TIGR02271 family)